MLGCKIMKAEPWENGNCLKVLFLYKTNLVVAPLKLMPNNTRKD
jgi:hypothetical protein